VVLPEFSGIELLKAIKAKHPDVEVILISGYGTVDTVIEGLRYGAVDFIKKPFSLVDVEFAISRTKRYLDLQKRLEESENKNSLINQTLERSINRKVIGKSPQMKKVLQLAILAGKDNDINVLITGENGTGKEIIAHVIHHSSIRSDCNFATVNSAAIPESLLESEFFGHRKGAFTDAKSDKKGYFEMANKGTLFLDEIADMPLILQGKLLRAIENKEIKPLGGSKTIKVDVRIISASNKDISNLMKQNRFRQDLYHRINTFQINIPPLRERPEDVEPLLKHFTEFFASRKNRPVPEIDQNVIKSLKKYSFPGNVRELQNMVERALLVSNNSILKLSDFPLSVDQYSSDAICNDCYNIEENEKMLILNALKKFNYNQTKAAQVLGISRLSLIRRLEKFNININKTIN
jgi:DNA-binding NtrC family response regulator